MIFNHLQKSDKIVDIIFQSSKQRDFPIIKFLHNYPFGLLIFEIINYNFPFFPISPPSFSLAIGRIT